MNIKTNSQPIPFLHPKTATMKYSNNVEVIIPSNPSFSRQSQKEFIEWLTTILQPAIDKQEIKSRKMLIKVWTQSPEIYLS